MSIRLLISGNLGGTNVGDSFAHAARSLGLDVRVAEQTPAFAGPRLWRAICRRIWKRHSPAWGAYNQFVQAELASFRPHLVLTTGVSPVSSDTLKCAAAIQAKCINYPTDDPWNPNHRNPRYLHSIADYDFIFTPRRSNLDDFRAAGVKRIAFLPFAYDPRFARPVPVSADFESPDVLFVGGGDADRVALLRPLVPAGLTLAIYGSYWGNDPLLKPSLRGQMGPDDICRATCAAKINLCLVRRQNRDGHVMRSYEIPAIGGCVLAEDTSEHRELFGETASYFTNSLDLVAQAKRLRDDAASRQAMASQAHQRILDGENTYADRLQTMLRSVM